MPHMEELMASYLLRLLDALSLTWVELGSQLELRCIGDGPFVDSVLRLPSDGLERIARFTGDPVELLDERLCGYVLTEGRSRITLERTRNQNPWLGYAIPCAACAGERGGVVQATDIRPYRFLCPVHGAWLGDRALASLDLVNDWPDFVHRAHQLAEMASYRPDRIDEAWRVASTATSACQKDPGSLAIEEIWMQRRQNMGLYPTANFLCYSFPEAVALAELLLDESIVDILEAPPARWDRDCVVALGEIFLPNAAHPNTVERAGRYLAHRVFDALRDDRMLQEPPIPRKQQRPSPLPA